MALAILNREELRKKARDIPLLEEIAQEVFSATRICSLQDVPTMYCAEPGWIVMQNGEGGGLGINPLGIEPACTALRRSVVCLRGAQLLAGWIQGVDAPGVALREEPGCPQEWSMMCVSTDCGSFLFGTSGLRLSGTSGDRQSRRKIPRVALRVLGELGADPDWRERTFIEIDRLAFEIESQAVCGSLCVWGENGMAMHGDERGGAVSLGDRGVLMRLDLGDIDLSLDEIVALRAGSVIELEGGTPLRCFMRVGSTVLAEGEVSVKDARLIVRVVSVLS